MIITNKKTNINWFKKSKKEKETSIISVVDVIAALTDANIPRNYWSDLKRRMVEEGSEVHEKNVQLKLRAKDGKIRETDTLDTEGIFRHKLLRN